MLVRLGLLRIPVRCGVIGVARAVGNSHTVCQRQCRGQRPDGSRDDIMPLGGAQSVHLRLPRNPSPCSLITQVGDRGEGKLIADNLVVTTQARTWTWLAVLVLVRYDRTERVLKSIRSNPAAVNTGNAIDQLDSSQVQVRA
jgi:hypothetical protein